MQFLGAPTSESFLSFELSPGLFYEEASVWNAASGQLLTKLEGHTGNVKDANFSPDGQRVVTASEDKTARVYRVVTLSDIAELLRK